MTHNANHYSKDRSESVKMNVLTAGSGGNDFENCRFPLLISLVD